MARLGVDAHIPIALRDNLLEMKSAPAITGNIPTIFVGIVHKEYTKEMWDSHSTRIKKLFKITDDKCCCNIMVVPAKRGEVASNIVDNEKLAEEMSRAMDMIANIQTKTIRIVGLGVGSSLAVTDALESLLRGWDIPANEKELQFVALGESMDFHYLNFCKSLCMKQMIKSLQYYNTMDFNNFGYLRTSGSGEVAGMNVAEMKKMAAMLGMLTGRRGDPTERDDPPSD